MTAVVPLLLALAAGPAVPAADPSAQAVTLDIIVEGPRREPLRTLGAADFTITEQGIPLTVSGVRMADEASRVFAVFLDEFHVAPGAAAARVRDALIALIRDELGPTDRIVVLKPLDSLIDILPARDREAAAHAIATFDPRFGDVTPRTSFERNFIAGAPGSIERARAQIAASSLDALATALGRLPGSRKTLVVVSDGFLPLGRRRGDRLPDIDSIALAANRARVAIYPVEGSIVAPGDPQTQDMAGRGPRDEQLSRQLRSLAERTTGWLLSARGDLGADLRRVLADAASHYSVTVSSAPADGRFHPVDVSVKVTGAKVRARSGYWSAPQSRPVPAAASLTASMVRRTSPLVRPWFGMSRASDGDTRVKFVWEPSPRIPGERGVAMVPARIALTVTHLDGTPVYDGVVWPSVGRTAGSADGQPARASFESAAGRLLVQMSIQDAAARIIDRDVRDLVVGRFPGPVTIGSAEVLRARSAREYQALLDNPDAAPVATRQFSRAERLLIRVPVFSAGQPPSVSARLVSGLGGTMRELPVRAASDDPTQFHVDVPLAALAAGAYSIELAAITPDGQARDTLLIRVTP